MNYANKVGAFLNFSGAVKENESVVEQTGYHELGGVDPLEEGSHCAVMT